MFLTPMLHALKARLSSTTGALAQEYALVSIVSAGIVVLIVKLVESDFFRGLVESFVSMLFLQLPRILAFVA